MQRRNMSCNKDGTVVPSGNSPLQEALQRCSRLVDGSLMVSDVTGIGEAAVLLTLGTALYFLLRGRRLNALLFGR